MQILLGFVPMFPLFLGLVAVSSKWISRIQEVEQFVDCPYEFHSGLGTSKLFKLH